MRLNGEASRAAMTAPPLSALELDETRYRCLDGILTSHDVAKVAGVSRKAARRAIEAFAQRGWAVDPAKCPAHNRHNHQPHKEAAVPESATISHPTPSPAAIAAQAKMFGLLQGNFDPDTGTYSGGYSDAKIAEECRLSVELVAAVRKQTFGELKVPSEVAQLNGDIEALEQLLTDAINPIQTELRALKQRVADCCRKFGG